MSDRKDYLFKIGLAHISPLCNMIAPISIGAHIAVLVDALLRADFEPSIIGQDSVIEDGVITHGSKGDFGTSANTPQSAIIA